MNEDMIEMVKECDCETCGLSENCNGVDLMNCYAKKKMVIKESEQGEGK